jgi:hypothetical protein
MLAAQTVPYDLRSAFLEQVAAELRGRGNLGDGLVQPHCLRGCPLDYVERRTGGRDVKKPDPHLGRLNSVSETVNCSSFPCFLVFLSFFLLLLRGTDGWLH